MSVTIGDITADGCTFQDNARMVSIETHAAAEADKDAEILEELRKACERLNETNPAIAKSLESLAEAVKAKDKKSIGDWLSLLTVGTAKDAIVKVASGALLSWMGIQ